MRYTARINKRIKYVKVYAITKRVGQRENLLTRLFVKLLTKPSGPSEPQVGGGAA
ncbi:MAG: hypothetical protein KGH98_00810 [Candidatus Micrarchaeota archaeon]|nr:hypothetical protein [Candidatus Micrarchaeota archaeon]